MGWDAFLSIICVSILVNILRWAAHHGHVAIVDKGNFPSGSHHQIICVNELPHYVTNGDVFKVVVTFLINHLACDSFGESHSDRPRSFDLPMSTIFFPPSNLLYMSTEIIICLEVYGS